MAPPPSDITGCRSSATPRSVDSCDPGPAARRSKIGRPTLGIYGPAQGEPSGVAAYSAVLEAGLSRHFDCVHVSNADPARPDEFDLVLYHLGGSARHHGAFQALDQRPGPAIIHEPNCLSYYYEAWDLLSPAKRAAVLTLFQNAFGTCFDGLPEVLAFLRAHPVHDEWSVDIGSELLYLNQVSVAMVHSAFVAAQLRQRWSERVVTIPQTVPRLSQSQGERMRTRLGVGPGDLVVGTFGFIGEYKRLDKVFAAWRAWHGKPPGSRLLVVGERQGDIEVPAWPDVLYPGFVSDDDFDACLPAADFAVQLRHPTLGETSIVVTKLIANGRTVVVSDTEYTTELPDEQVVRVRPDGSEVPNLVDAFECLALRRAARRTTRYDERHAARNCADQVARVIRGESGR